MGFIILITIGAVFGYLTSLLAREETLPETGRYVIVGMAGALTAGLLTAQLSLLSGITVTALAIGALAAIVSLAAMKAVSNIAADNAEDGLADRS